MDGAWAPVAMESTTTVTTEQKDLIASLWSVSYESDRIGDWANSQTCSQSVK